MASTTWERIKEDVRVVFDRDPAARASFGIYSPETRKTVHMREIF